MTKYAALVLLIALRFVHQPADAEASVAPFTSPTPSFAAATTAAKLLYVDGHVANNKIILDWVVNENETADQFEIEKSIDGKHFTVAALVFGSDKSAKGTYQFYEKAGNHKVSYRIKLINKNQQPEYSAVIEI